MVTVSSSRPNLAQGAEHPARGAQGRVDGLVETRLVHLHGVAALVALLVAATFGLVAALQLVLPDLTGSTAWLTWGRLRYNHTQGIMLGWLGNAFLAFLYHAVPLLTGRPVTSPRLGRWIFGLWNFAIVLPGWALVSAGVSQPLEWAEFPLIVDAFVVVGLLLALVQFLPPFFSRGLDDLYVSSWYIIGGLVFTVLAYPMGNFVPEFVPGAGGAAFSGLWIHDAVGLFVTPLALAIIYYVIPASTGRPIYSHFLSMLGFWLLFFLYPLNGTHHYVFSVIPMEAQLTAIIASALLGVDVVIVVANLLFSVRGAGSRLRGLPLRFVVTSTVFYLVVSIQGASQAQMAINETVHFTDWVVAHSHLAMLGFASFAAAGGLIHVWQRIPWARYHAGAFEWAYWLMTAGLLIMFVSLTIGGLVEARHWQSAVPWLDSVRDAQPYWLWRVLSGIPLTGGFIALLLGLTTGPRGGGLAALGVAAPARQHEAEAAAAPGPGVGPSRLPALSGAGRAVRMSYVVASVAGVAFFAMSVALLGIWPGRVLETQAQAMAPARPLPLTASEERGRAIYAREGCAYCHTQQIRHVDADIARFGAPTLAWEGRFDYPHLWGTRRIGPDLARAGGTRSEDWQYMHLFAPRAVVPLSVMPSYARFFDGAPDRPRQEARDLVAYLETLGRARELAGPEGEAHARQACNCPDDDMAQMAFHAPLLNAHAGRTRRQGEAPALARDGDRTRGLALYRDYCAGCHGADGNGDGPGAAGLLPRPSNLTEHQYTQARLAHVFANGVFGTSMPAWRDVPAADLAALATVVHAFSAPQDTTAPSPDVMAIGAKVYTANCVQCHGEQGGGDGWAANELRMVPGNFQGQRPSPSRALEVLRTGIPGTQMAAWSQRLSKSEMEAVAAYVRGFFRPDAPRTGDGTR